MSAYDESRHLDQLPPHSNEAEAALLGCCLMDANVIGDVLEELPADEAFFDLRNRIIWQHLKRAYQNGGKPDTVVLYQSLKDAGELDQVEFTYMQALPDLTPGPAAAVEYLPIVRDKWLLRRTISACQKNVHELMGANGSVPVSDLLAAAELRVQSATEVRLNDAEKSMAQVVADVSENVLEKYRRGHKYRVGPQLGFNYLDNIMPGLVPGQFITLAARPGAGKSAMAMQIAENLALAQKLPVGFVSLEMSARSLGLREVFQHAGADLTKFLNGFLIDAQIESLRDAVIALQKAPIWIDESPRMAIEDLEVRARRMKRAHDIQLLVIDYFQLLYSRNPRPQWSKSDELASISMRLKALAKELGIPILVCAQMNRQIEQDANRRPRLSDLKDTGQLEQDSDVVIFLWRPAVSFEEGPVRRRLEQVIARVPVDPSWKTWNTNAEGHNWRHYLAVINATVEKQREGRSGVDALMVFIKPWTRFVDGYTPAAAPGAEVPDPQSGLF